MQDILAFASNYNRWTPSMQYAGEFASRTGASLDGIFVIEPIVPMSSLTMPVAFPEIYSVAADSVREAHAAEPAFKARASEFGIGRCQWLVARGYLAPALAHAANWHDLLVIGAGGESPWGSVGMLGEVLLTCGLPCLVVPETTTCKASVNTIAVAWKGSPESVRAVHAAMPLLKRATQVVLLFGEGAPPLSTIDWRPPLDIANHLTRHDVRFTKRPFHAADDDVGANLLRAAQEIGADLLVMGAYGRSRFSEWILGGATRYVLEHSTLPLFMRH
jgi:nucleotide-binding universal stress UspA family protein